MKNCFCQNSEYNIYMYLSTKHTSEENNILYKHYVKRRTPIIGFDIWREFYNLDDLFNIWKRAEIQIDISLP